MHPYWHSRYILNYEDDDGQDNSYLPYALSTEIYTESLPQDIFDLKHHPEKKNGKKQFRKS